VARKRTKRATLHTFLELEAQLNELSISVEREEWIRDRLRAGKNLTEVAREASVDVGIVQRIKDGKSGFDKEAFEVIMGQIKEFCSQLQLPPRPSIFFGAERPYAEWFCDKLGWRWKSSADYAEYGNARNHLLTHLAEISARRQRDNLREKAQQRHKETANRNIALAQEYLRRRNPNQSASALKESIGRKADLVRSTSIAAIDDGLRRLGKR
jgi:hypothetical protein